MSRETSAPPLVDALKASTSKLKETKSVLDARAKELDALKAQLDDQRQELEKQAARLEANREALSGDRAAFQEDRASVDKDLAAIAESREKLADEERRLQEGAKALEARARANGENEERVERLGKAFNDRIRDTEASFQALVEHEGELIKLQNDWLAGFEAQGKALLTIREEMNARQKESGQQHDSLAELQNAFRDELRRLVAEREKLEEKEKSVFEAQSYLATALEAAGIEVPDGLVPMPVPVPAQEPPESPQPQPPEAPPAVEYVAHEETEATPKVTKAEALNLLTRAIETWKRARDAGSNVGDMKKILLHAKNALESGDYQTALRLANEVLQQAHTTPLAR